MSYRKVGGLHFVRVGRFGFSFFWSRKPRALSAAQKRELREARREANMALLRGTAGAKPLLPIDWSEPQYQFDLPKVTSGGNR